MSLRIFHVVFIAICLMLCLFVGVWGVRQYASTGSGSNLTVGIVFIGCGIALIVYAVRMFQKLKDVS
jgi:DNA-binding transcriptional regulator of glucitol operon